MAGRRSYRASRARLFWSFTGLGALLSLLGPLALIAAALVGMLADHEAGVAIALTILQPENLLGEVRVGHGLMQTQSSMFTPSGAANAHTA
ncbi:MAG: hypothetical protein HGA45_33140 [Chloroflexales bacterium]|nr:hypothetical protein [Chloroflexales bacterium]